MNESENFQELAKSVFRTYQQLSECAIKYAVIENDMLRIKQLAEQMLIMVNDDGGHIKVANQILDIIRSYEVKE